jgi:hypothetical protein
VFVFRPLLVTQKLIVAEMDSEEGGLTPAPKVEVPRATLNFRDPKGRVKIFLRIPEPRDYVLSIYAKEVRNYRLETPIFLTILTIQFREWE